MQGPTAVSGGKMSDPSREDKYRQLVENATDALFAVNEAGEFEIVNGEFLDLVGYDREGLVGSPVTDILPEGEVSGWEQRVNLLQTDEMSESDTWSARVRTAHGMTVTVDFQLSALGTGGQSYEGIVGIARDTRERQRREQRLNVLNRALRHNIRNRMNLILGKAETLQGVDDDGYRAAATQIEAVSQEVINISNKARKAHKHLGPAPEGDLRIDVAEMADHVVTKFSISYPNATVETNLPDSALARAPPSFEVALVELLENAVIHHPSGNGAVTVTVETIDREVSVHVDDECDPVPETVVDTIHAGEERPLHHNEGIGLWIVEWVAETVDANLTFATRSDGEGNRVTLTFDAADE